MEHRYFFVVFSLLTIEGPHGSSWHLQLCVCSWVLGGTGRYWLVLIGTCRTEPRPAGWGTCRWPHGPWGWTPQGSTWTCTPACSGPAAGEEEGSRQHHGRHTFIVLYQTASEELELYDNYDNNKYGMYLEVDGVNPQHEGMELAEAQETLLQVVYLAHGIHHAGHDGNAVFPDRGGAWVGGRPVGEVGLGLGVHSHQPGAGERETWRSICINLLPKLYKTVVWGMEAPLQWRRLRPYLDRASAPISSVLLDMTLKKSLTTPFCLSDRLILAVQDSYTADVREGCLARTAGGVYIGPRAPPPAPLHWLQQ